MINDPAKFAVCISDNGLGLDEANYKSFKTPFSGHKLKQHGRGFGRFIAFKVFSKIVYASRYEFFNDKQERHFRFDIQQDEEIAFIDKTVAGSETGVRVDYGAPLTDWHDLIRDLNTAEIAEEIGSHFLPYFLY